MMTGFKFRKLRGGGLIIDMQSIPREACIPQKTVLRGMQEGWISVEGGRGRVQCGGAYREADSKHHEFLNADKITIHEVDRDVIYNVTHQPGKYLQERWDGGFASKKHVANQLVCRVDWFFHLELDEVREKAGVSREALTAHRITGG